MNKRFLIFSLIVLGVQLPSNAQITDFQKEFEEFTRQAQQEYEDFRNQANKEYANFMRKAWKTYIAKPKIKKPEEKPIPPKVYPKEEEKEPIKDIPKPYAEVVPVVEPKPQPTPIEPIRESPQPVEKYHKFSFFKTDCRVRLDDNQRFALSNVDRMTLASVWEKLASDGYNNLIYDCLAIRDKLRLCDWAYFLMLKDLTDSYLGKGTNESTMLCAYIFAQSGYKMRLGIGTNRLYMMVGSNHLIFNKPYWQIDNDYFYALDCKEQSLDICGASMPNERSMSLLLNDLPVLAERRGTSRTLQSEAYKDIVATLYSDENLVEFFGTYPSSKIGNNVCSRWAIYANTPISESIKKQLYPVLENAIAGKSQKDAANRLLNFVQTAFVYEYDDKVWGSDRAFFAEESLYYPYCDCEDRSILFSRLVRDLMGLKVLLIYYPGHLATAVNFTEPVTGDYISLEGRKFVVCDPTYIGAPVGTTMPNMDNGAAKVIELTK